MARLTTYNVVICMIVAIGTFGYGYGFGVFITSIGQPGFYKDFNLDPTSDYTAAVLGAVNALFAVGAAMGSIAQGWLADWIGRKKALAVSALFALVGAAWTAGSPYLAMLITIRILHGFGLGMLICLVPLYLTEVSPPHCRGLMSGMTVMGFGLGYVAVAWVSVGTFYAKNQTMAWRLPLALATVGPIGLLAGVYFVPESPRYLCLIGKPEAALGIIQHLHRDPSDPNNHAAEAEFVQIRAQVEKDREEKSGYIEMFRRPALRRRSLLVIFLMFASQATGVNGIANYLIPIFGSLGLKGSMPLIVYAVYAVIGTTAAFIACFTMDKFGRRRLFLIGFPAIAANLLIEAMLQLKYVGTDDQAGNSAAVACIFLFIILFQFIDAPSFVWCSEIWPTTVRAKGIGLSMASYFIGFVTFSAPGPLAFKNIKWRMYLIFMGLCIICEVVVYFYVPETRGKPVEEMGALFGEEVVLHMTADGRGLVEKSDGMVLEELEVVQGRDTA